MSIFYTFEQKMFRFTVLEWQRPKIQSQLEDEINTKIRQPAVIPCCCSRQFCPPAAREQEKDPKLLTSNWFLSFYLFVHHYRKLASQ